MSLLVLRGGLFTTVQDLGRRGSLALGVPPSGAMDEVALRAGNLLVGNEEGEAGLEWTLVGPEILFESPAVVALTGSRFEASVGGSPTPHAAAFRVAAGQALALGMSLEGARGYLAIRGGLDVPLVLGSRSTYVSGGFGGLAGRALGKSDRLGVRPGPAGADAIFRLAKSEALPAYSEEVALRVIRGPQEDAFRAPSVECFYSQTYRVLGRSDRTGIRLRGEEPIAHERGADSMPEGIPAGGIQVPGDGQPIVLAVDRPVTGGYAKIATVIHADLGLLAQAKPGDRVRFASVDVETARALAEERDRRLRTGIARA